MFTSILKGILALFGIVDKGEDIVKKNQEVAQRDHDTKQGEQNANSKTTAEGLAALINADLAAHDPAVLDSVRRELRRP